MYGTPTAQEILKKWLEDLSDENGERMVRVRPAGSDDSGDDDKDDDDKDEV